VPSVAGGFRFGGHRRANRPRSCHLHRLGAVLQAARAVGVTRKAAASEESATPVEVSADYRVALEAAKEAGADDETAKEAAEQAVAEANTARGLGVRTAKKALVRTRPEQTSPATNMLPPAMSRTAAAIAQGLEAATR
jgi:hypothetical protein